MISAPFPEKLQPLFIPKRYKVLWGGRGAGRSWGIARALLIKGRKDPLRVLCAREFQNSISESVHKVLADQIKLLGMEDFYEVQKQGIYGKNGTSFYFEGIKNNITRIKSYEGIDVCWVEEAVKVSKNSWKDLIPTIRKANSEIWLSFNPELDTDYTYVTFVKNANLVEDDSFVIHMTYRDNPWFSPELRREMEKMRAMDYDSYLNVWEGQCLVALEGAVYAKEMQNVTSEGRIMDVPWDRDYPVDVWMDLGAGRSDFTSIWFAQQVNMQNRLLHYYENNLADTLHYSIYMKNRLPYSYGTIWLPHDAEAVKFGRVKTIKQQFQEQFPNNLIRIVPKLSIAEGVNSARLLFPNCFFDKDGCHDGLEALRHYRYKVVDGQYSREPMHDNYSHGADAFRYLAMTIKGTGQTARRDSIKGRLEQAKEFARKVTSGLPTGSNGWMG